eukprot:GHVU01232483.1.p1 GENE.GHVU01232483.1~~GHVU01232483.1.p1  ORF type:complete len:186 (+),score=26.19 GHVU01232483.1:745-1302(+)
MSLPRPYGISKMSTFRSASAPVTDCGSIRHQISSMLSAVATATGAPPDSEVKPDVDEETEEEDDEDSDDEEEEEDANSALASAAEDDLNRQRAAAVLAVLDFRQHCPAAPGIYTPSGGDSWGEALQGGSELGCAAVAPPHTFVASPLLSRALERARRDSQQATGSLLMAAPALQEEAEPTLTQNM